MTTREIVELIDLFAQADIVLQAALQESLSREALNLTIEHAPANDGSD
jgi:hypothetical protein